MSDADFEKFAGGAFLQGLNPILIVHDHPPLGRYVISLSIFLFDNPNTIMLAVYSLIAISMFLLGRLVLKSPWLALIPLGLFFNEPLITHGLIETPLPEPIQLPFILFAFYFFLKGFAGKKELGWFLATSFMLGCVVSSRFFVLGAAMTGSMGLYLLLTHRLSRKTLVFIATLPVSLVVLLVTYFRTFQSGYSLIQVLSIQKYILAYHKSKFVLPFSVWDLLLFNRWHTWWADRAILSDARWTIFWPVATIGTGVSIIQALRARFRGIDDGEKFLMLWVSVHLLMLSTGYTTSRYFLPLLPILYILTTAGIIRIGNQYLPKSKVIKPKKVKK